jgi:hypothetical protein
MPSAVGFVGAGRVTQAIHQPTLAHVSELFTVSNVTDINHGRVPPQSRPMRCRRQLSATRAGPTPTARRLQEIAAVARQHRHGEQ